MRCRHRLIRPDAGHEAGGSTDNAAKLGYLGARPDGIPGPPVGVVWFYQEHSQETTLSYFSFAGCQIAQLLSPNRA
jgi:hypothetical protein